MNNYELFSDAVSVIRSVASACRLSPVLSSRQSLAFSRQQLPYLVTKGIVLLFCRPTVTCKLLFPLKLPVCRRLYSLAIRPV